MLARVAMFEGGSAESIQNAIDRIKSDSQSGPPEGVPSVGFTLLADKEGGRVIAIGLFEDEEKLRQGDATLNEMSPPDDGFGSRKSVDVYEVGADIRV